MKAHPAAEIFPMLGPAELASLAKDIGENGQLMPIISYKGQILDGRNRWRACELIHEQPWVEEWDGEGSPTAFVISVNVRRRHLDASQLAMVAARAKPMFEAEAKDRQRAGGAIGAEITNGTRVKANLPEVEPVQSRDKAAALVNVSPRSVESASRVIDRGVPALVEAVERGEIAVSAAAEVAKLPPKKQEAVVAAGPAAVRAEAKQSREAKKRDDGEALAELKKWWKKAGNDERREFIEWIER